MEELDEIEQEVIDVWDEDEFAPRGEDFLPLSVSIGKYSNPEAVTLMMDAVDASFSVRLHKEELKMIAKKLLEKANEL